MPTRGRLAPHEGHTMGIWIELGVFLVALGVGVWQLRDVKKAQAERRAREASDSTGAGGGDARSR